MWRVLTGEIYDHQGALVVHRKGESEIHSHSEIERDRDRELASLGRYKVGRL